MNFWATWCVPCREEFPDLVAAREGLSRTGARGPRRLDRLGQGPGRRRQVSRREEPGLSQLPKEAAATTRSSSSRSTDWGGELPFTVLYARDGKKAKVLSGKQYRGGLRDGDPRLCSSRAGAGGPCEILPVHPPGPARVRRPGAREAAGSRTCRQARRDPGVRRTRPERRLAEQKHPEQKGSSRAGGAGPEAEQEPDPTASSPSATSHANAAASGHDGLPQETAARTGQDFERDVARAPANPSPTKSPASLP